MFPGQHPSFESDVTFPPLTPEQVMENTGNKTTLYVAIDQFPPVQARWVYTYYIFGIGRTDLEWAKGVGISRISGSIDYGLLHLKNILQKIHLEKKTLTEVGEIKRRRFFCRLLISPTGQRETMCNRSPIYKRSSDSQDKNYLSQRNQNDFFSG